MDFYFLLVDLFADEEPFSYFTALALSLATVFSAFVTLNRSDEYIKSPDMGSFGSVKKSAKVLYVVSVLLLQWCIFAAVYLIVYKHHSGVGAVYIIITALAVGAAVFSVISRNKYTKAKNAYNALFFKANKGNLSALAGNPLGLEGQEREAFNSILNSGGVNGGGKSDPLNDILTGAVKIEKSTPAEAAIGSFEQAAGGDFRECPFCKSRVEKKYPICIYCGKLIPDREKDYRSENGELSGWERADR